MMVVDKLPYIIYGMTGIDTSSFTFPMLMRVTGMSGAYNTPQVNPRFQSDIVDLRPPTVTGTNPADAALDVNLYRPLEATFSKAMDPASLTPATFTLVDSIGPVSGAVSYDAGSSTASFTPDASLSPFTIYTATLTTGVTDIYAIPLSAPYEWSFTTGAADVTPPAIVGVFPLEDATEVALTANVVITFTEDMHPSSLDEEHFILEGPFGTVPYHMSYNSTNFVVTLNPDAKFLATTLYTVTVLGTTADWAGLTLGEDKIWSFETSIEPPMLVYFGDIHNHTSYSDGSGTPAQALAAGEAAGFRLHGHLRPFLRHRRHRMGKYPGRRRGCNGCQLCGPAWFRIHPGRRRSYQCLQHRAPCRPHQYGLHLLRLHPQPGSRINRAWASTNGLPPRV